MAEIGKSKEMIPRTTRHGLLMVLFVVLTAIELWLWKIGHANQHSLYLGLAFAFGAIVNAVQYINYRNKA